MEVLNFCKIVVWNWDDYWGNLTTTAQGLFVTSTTGPTVCTVYIDVV